MAEAATGTVPPPSPATQAREERFKRLGLSRPIFDTLDKMVGEKVIESKFLDGELILGLKEATEPDVLRALNRYRTVAGKSEVRNPKTLLLSLVRGAAERNVANKTDDGKKPGYIQKGAPPPITPGREGILRHGPGSSSPDSGRLTGGSGSGSATFANFGRHRDSQLKPSPKSDTEETYLPRVYTPKGSGKKIANKKPTPYGLVLWTNVNGNYLFLAQIGYSASFHDFKIDPLRGRIKEGETPWQAATREAFDESKQVLDFRRVDGETVTTEYKNLFHVRVQFEEGVLEAVNDEFDNRADHEDIFGLIWLPIFKGADKMPTEPGYKISKQLKDMLNISESYKFDEMPVVSLVKEGNTFVAQSVAASAEVSDEKSPAWRFSKKFPSLPESEQKKKLLACRVKQARTWPQDRVQMQAMLGDEYQEVAAALGLKDTTPAPTPTSSSAPAAPFASTPAAAES